MERLLSAVEVDTQGTWACYADRVEIDRHAGLTDALEHLRGIAGQPNATIQVITRAQIERGTRDGIPPAAGSKFATQRTADELIAKLKAAQAAAQHRSGNPENDDAQGSRPVI